MREQVRGMAERLRHRGPDGEGVWVDAEAGVALGHRRLSIIELSAAGAQPMASESGRYVTVFNGEIYNFRRLREELKGRGHRFRGQSDTEVMLAASEEWGPAEAARRLEGMFAIAMWDRRERELWLMRDRIGEKPLYYGWCGGVFLFGSELKALQAHAEFRGEIDVDSVARYLRYGYVPGPGSIFRGIYKLPPGTTARVGADPGAAVQPAAYWSVREVAERGQREGFAGTSEEAIGELDRVLREVVQEQMVADVPLGAFLSGGIDSSLITALMQAQSGSPVRTFTIGFHEKNYNEAEHALAVAKHLGTAHTELYVTAEDARGVIPDLPQIFDEPFADSSQIPTLLLSRMTRQHVTVSLSGDGGDELFGGYKRYTALREMWGAVRWMGQGGRRALAATLNSIPDGFYDRILNPALASRYGRKGRSSLKVRRFSEMLAATSNETFYEKLISTWTDPLPLQGDAHPRLSIEKFPRQMPPEQGAMLLDSLMYLPDDIMVKVDRSSMAVSLESRAPFLDRRTVELAWGLPFGLKVRDGVTKWIVRQLLYRYVPQTLVDRPKTGFGVPVGAWLRGPLRDWAEDLLSPERLRNDGVLAVDPIRRTWEDHLSGQAESPARLWNVLMFQSWMETWFADMPVPAAALIS